jgi:hypothetical protein
MRSTLFIAASIAAAISCPALAASQSGDAGSNGPANAAPTQSSAPDSPSATPPATTSSAGGSAADTSATAGGALSVGEPVKDNTGATIGAISSLNTAANGQQMAVIKMGNDTFQVPTTGLGVADGAATINMSQSQITSKLHPAAGGR